MKGLQGKQESSGKGKLTFYICLIKKKLGVIAMHVYSNFPGIQIIQIAVD